MRRSRIGYALLSVGGLCTITLGARMRRVHTSALPYFRTAQLTPEWLDDREATATSMHRIAPFRATDQRGEEVREQSLDGRVTIVQFFFTKCGDLCPMTTTNLRRVVSAFGDTLLQVLSYSVTPGGDSVAALRRYAEVRGITDPRWHLLTAGDSATWRLGDSTALHEVQRLAKDSYFVRLGADTTYGVASIAHTETLVLIDGQRRIRGFYAGTLPLEMRRLQDDVETLLHEPSRRVADLSSRCQVGARIIAG